MMEKEFSPTKIDKQLQRLLLRDSHIGIGMLEKMDTGNFDGEEKAFFCWLQSYYFGTREDVCKE